MSRRARRLTGRHLLNLFCAAVIVAAGIVAGLATTSSSTPTSLTRTATVSQGTVQEIESTTGTIAPAQTFSLNFSTAGTVTAVDVSVGQQVTQGEVLATVESTAAQAAVTEAQDNLTAAQDRLDQDETGTGTGSSGSSGNGASEDSSGGGSAADPPSTTTTGGSGSGSGGSGASVSTSTTATTEAPTTTTTTTYTPNPATIASDEESVASAQQSLAEAQTELAGTTLAAPASGTVTAINGVVGQSVSAGTSTTTGSQAAASSSSSGAAGNAFGGASATSSSSETGSSSSSSAFMTITDLGQLDVTCDVPEADVSEIQVGQSATVSLDSSGAEMAATVAAISPTGTTSEDVVDYPVTLTLVDPPTSVLSGMSATVNIVIDQVDDVLVVPSDAVTGSGKTGTVTVEKSNGQEERVPVVIGLQGTSTTAVYGDLSVGEEVVLPTITITPSTGSSSTGTGLGGTGLSDLGGGGGFSGFGGGGFSDLGGGGFRGRG